MRLVQISVLILLPLLLSTQVRAAELADIVARGSVRIGVCLGFEPMGFRDSDNQARGYDVDIANLAAAALALDLDLIEVDATSLETILATGKVDFAACGRTVTPRRARDLDFSLPYLRTGLKVLVRKNSPLTGLADLGGGARVVSIRDTTGEALVRDRVPNAKILYVANSSDALLMLRQGQADAYVADAVGVDHLIRLYPDELLALPTLYSNDSFGLVLSKGNPDLLRWLDVFVSTFVTSGQYETLYRKWWHQAPPGISAPW